MRIKTMLIIIITILLTVVIMQNNDPVTFKFLFAHFYISKLVMLLLVAVVSFVVGVLVGRPGRPKYIPGQPAETDIPKKQTGTLSEEDRDYIS
jgi:hypothetical protein